MHEKIISRNPLVSSCCKVRRNSTFHFSFSEWIKKQFDISIITSNRDLGATKPYVNIKFNKWLNLSGVNIVYLYKLKINYIHKCIQKQCPNIIYLNSFFDITTQVLIFLKLKGKIK